MVLGFRDSLILTVKWLTVVFKQLQLDGVKMICHSRLKSKRLLYVLDVHVVRLGLGVYHAVSDVINKIPANVTVRGRNLMLNFFN